jgi:RNA polymerase sigma-70 factor (ECF subfamily)
LCTHDARAFEAAFREIFPEIHRFAHRRFDRDTADDVAAETFAIALRRWEALDRSKPVRPWLYGIALNVMRHRHRDERRRLRAYARAAIRAMETTTDGDAIDARLDASSARSELAAGLASLRRQELEVLLLHAWPEFSDEEIAATLEIPLGTVKSRLSRARTKIGNRMAPIGQSVVDERSRPLRS